MKLAFADYTDLSGGVLEEFDYKIKASPTMFFVMVSALAKDKIGYPVRELCTNAWDAARGEFTVSLPTIWAPEFKVRDFGPGLSHKQMMSLYTTIGGSSKDKSNDAVGGLGIGSKSFFAYLIKGDELGASGSGSAAVRAYQNGRVRSYVMSIAGDGRPVCKMIGDEATLEANGLEVSFPVRAQDVAEFKAKARQILWSFAPRPKISPDPDWDEPIVLRSGKGWAEYDPLSVPWKGPSVRMGCVLYPIDPEPRWPWRDTTILFEAPIGSLSVQASRESLAYDDRTKRTIAGLIEAFENDQAVVAQNVIENAPSYLHACRLWAQSAYPTDVRNHLAQKILFQGRELRTEWVFAHGGEHRFTLTSAPLLQFPPTSRRERTKALYAENLSEDIRVCIERSCDRSQLRLKEAGLDDGKTFLWLRYDKKGGLAALFDMFGLTANDVIDLDAIKLPPRPKSDRKPQMMRMMTALNGVYVEEEVDLNEGGAYCVVESFRRGRPSYRAQAWRALESIRDKIPALNAIKLALPRLSQVERLQKAGGWRAASVHFQEWFEATIDWDAPILIDGTGGALSYRVEEIAKFLHQPEFPDDVRAFGEFITAKKERKSDPNVDLYIAYRNAFPNGRVASNLVTQAAHEEALLRDLKQKYPLFEEFAGILYNAEAYGRIHDPKIVEAVATYLTLKNGAQP